MARSSQKNAAQRRVTRQISAAHALADSSVAQEKEIASRGAIPSLRCSAPMFLCTCSEYGGSQIVCATLLSANDANPVTGSRQSPRRRSILGSTTAAPPQETASSRPLLQ